LTFHQYAVSAPVHSGTYDFYALGAAYDQKNILVQAELIELRTGYPGENVNGWYVMGGYRLDKWMPYIIYAVSHQNQSADGAIPESNAPTISVGVRFDVFNSVDIKAQFDHAKQFDFGTPFINIQPGFRNEADIFSLAVDFVF
jgi:hypothetical protein